jgi:hypothetical protein
MMSNMKSSFVDAIVSSTCGWSRFTSKMCSVSHEYYIFKLIAIMVANQDILVS